MDTSYWFGLAITALILLATHWFPWPRKLHRVEAYSIGVGAILIGQGVWLFCIGEQRLWASLVVFALVSGVAVTGAYAVDTLLRYRVKKAINGTRQADD